MPSNQAAWLKDFGSPLVVDDAPYTCPAEREIVIETGAVAVNPVDSGEQMLGIKLFPWLKCPLILGCDLAGEVVEVGSAVTRFKTGDRVLALPASALIAEYTGGAFQSYVTSIEHMTAPIPDTLSYEQACVLPLTLITAASGLYEKGFLELQHPTITTPPNPTGKTLLIWGGATSVGSNAIQLAVASGYDVVTTSSPKNFKYVQNLGASQVFDYNSKTINEDLSTALESKTMAGTYDCIGINGAFQSCAEVLLKTSGSKFIASAMPPPAEVPEGISTKFIHATAIQHSEVGAVIFEQFLPKALAEGSFVAAPDAHVVGKGLECVQTALDVLGKGVSARKVVVSL